MTDEPSGTLAGEEQPVTGSLIPALPPNTSASGRAAAARLSGGPVFYLFSLGLVAALTIGIFLGIGLLFLLHDPVGRRPAATRSIPPGAALISAETRPAPPPAGKAAVIPAAGSIASPRNSHEMPEQMPAAPAEGGDGSDRATAATASSPSRASPPEPPANRGAEPSRPAGAGRAPPSAAEIATLLADGDALFRKGDLDAARLSYRQAVAAGEGRGALGIGATYDPAFVGRFGVHGASADLAEARSWYRRALDLGATEAEGRLTELEAGPQR